jgi:hypothetical protein
MAGTSSTSVCAASGGGVSTAAGVVTAGAGVVENGRSTINQYISASSSRTTIPAIHGPGDSSFLGLFRLTMTGGKSWLRVRR